VNYLQTVIKKPRAWKLREAKPAVHLFSQGNMPPPNARRGLSQSNPKEDIQMLKKFRSLAFAFFLLASPFACVGCEEGTMEEMGEEIDDEVDDATDDR
jgi:hypothetical protein